VQNVIDPIETVTPPPRPIFASPIDEQFPVWARRSNPIIRYHLGGMWKTFPPNGRVLLRMVALQAVIIAISLVAPIIFSILMPMVMVALAMIPIGFILYARILVQSSSTAAAYVVDEQRHQTLDLLLLIPQPRPHILYAKLAAALWPHAENLTIVAWIVGLLSLPLMIIQYDFQYGLDSAPLLVRLALLGGVVAALLRVWLEPVMMVALGAMYGAASGSRSQAITATILTMAAYLLLINLARLLPVDPIWHIVIETILPVTLPPLITVIALRLVLRIWTK